MSIAASVDRYLNRSGVKYDVIAHTRTSNSSESAQAARVPGDRLVKSVLLHDSNGYLIAVLPATRRVDLDALDAQLGRQLEFAPEHDLANLFRDCEPGAIPPLGEAYGVETVIDDDMLQVADVYFEGGDHRALVHVSTEDFLRLVGDAQLLPLSH